MKMGNKHILQVFFCLKHCVKMRANSPNEMKPHIDTCWAYVELLWSLWKAYGISFIYTMCFCCDHPFCKPKPVSPIQWGGATSPTKFLRGCANHLCGQGSSLSPSMSKTTARKATTVSTLEGSQWTLGARTPRQSVSTNPISKPSSRQPDGSWNNTTCPGLGNWNHLVAKVWETLARVWTANHSIQRWWQEKITTKTSAHHIHPWHWNGRGVQRNIKEHHRTSIPLQNLRAAISASTVRL